MGSTEKRLGKFHARVRKGPYRNNALTKTFTSRVEATKWLSSLKNQNNVSKS
mgnify:CR=1 FL=1